MDYSINKKVELIKNNIDKLNLTQKSSSYIDHVTFLLTVIDHLQQDNVELMSKLHKQFQSLDSKFVDELKVLLLKYNLIHGNPIG